MGAIYWRKEHAQDQDVLWLDEGTDVPSGYYESIKAAVDILAAASAPCECCHGAVYKPDLDNGEVLRSEWPEYWAD